MDGITQLSTPLIAPNDTINLTYTVHAIKPGSFWLNKTSMMYADQDGNYHLIYSNPENVEVLSPLIVTAPQDSSGNFIQNLISWIKGLDPSAQQKTGDS